MADQFKCIALSRSLPSFLTPVFVAQTQKPCTHTHTHVHTPGVSEPKAWQPTHDPWLQLSEAFAWQILLLAAFTQKSMGAKEQVAHAVPHGLSFCVSV